jgi:hypothetical protein
MRLSEITFRLPAAPPSRDFLTQLGRLLAGVPYAEAGADRLTLTPRRPAGALPVTRIALAGVAAPEVAVGGRTLTGAAGGTAGGAGAGDSMAGGSGAGGLEMPELVRRLAGHVHRVDHTGVNLPAADLPTGRWRELVREVAAGSTMYRYPGGEPWPFVLPSTAAELAGDIGDFTAGREPRFELVYDRWRTRIEWQFALGTDLTRTDLEALFPEPDGTTFPDLAEVFRVVAVRQPWPGLDVRFDLCYRVEGGPTDWDTGEWLVTEGGRIR